MIISGADNSYQFQEMLSICSKYAGQHYPFKGFQFNNFRPKHQKIKALLETLNDNQWALWMDADSVLMRPIPELINCDTDIALVIKEPEAKSNRYGSYFYSGLIFVRKSTKSRIFLNRWLDHLPKYASDQRSLNAYISSKYQLTDDIYRMIGETIRVDGVDIKLLDPNIYVARAPIIEMRPSDCNEKIIHFKGKLQKNWEEYRKKFLC